MKRTRLKREEFKRTKHDSTFSQWKVLIGAFDWEDYSSGKEGAEKYRTQNLPNWTCCPGVYELAIAPSHPQSARKLDSSFVVPVYLGQADNLRTRLQQYGRDGAHLENGCCGKGPGLFTDTFSRGLPILYRCAPMKSKKDAEMIERQLLDVFDYAWNKGCNGARRLDDIYKVLDRRAKASQFSLVIKKIVPFNHSKVGIKITTGSNSSSIYSRILGIRRLQPRQEQYSSDDYCGNDVCGVSIGLGSICTAPPVAGRRRCGMHKGLRVNGCVSKLNIEGKLPTNASTDAHCRELGRRGDDENYTRTCGFILDGNVPCQRKPLEGNKRCLEHKGRRIRKSNQSLQRDVGNKS